VVVVTARGRYAQLEKEMFVTFAAEAESGDLRY